MRRQRQGDPGRVTGDKESFFLFLSAPGLCLSQVRAGSWCPHLFPHLILTVVLEVLQNGSSRRESNLQEVTLPGSKCFLMLTARWSSKDPALPPLLVICSIRRLKGCPVGSGTQQSLVLVHGTGWPGNASGGCIKSLYPRGKVENMKKMSGLNSCGSAS